MRKGALAPAPHPAGRPRAAGPTSTMRDSSCSTHSGSRFCAAALVICLFIRLYLCSARWCLCSTPFSCRSQRPCREEVACQPRRREAQTASAARGLHAGGRGRLFLPRSSSRAPRSLHAHSTLGVHGRERPAEPPGANCGGSRCKPAQPETHGERSSAERGQPWTSHVTLTNVQKTSVPPAARSVS